MKASTPLAGALCAAILLSGCATPAPSGTGNTVRAIMASQVIAPEAKASVQGSDAGTAILAYKNYQGSFAAPEPQVEISLFGRK